MIKKIILASVFLLVCSTCFAQHRGNVGMRGPVFRGGAGPVYRNSYLGNRYGYGYGYGRNFVYGSYGYGLGFGGAGVILPYPYINYYYPLPYPYYYPYTYPW